MNLKSVLIGEKRVKVAVLLDLANGIIKQKQLNKSFYLKQRNNRHVSVNVHGIISMLYKIIILSSDMESGPIFYPLPSLHKLIKL